MLGGHAHSELIAELRSVYHETRRGALQYLLYVFAVNVANRSRRTLVIPLIRLRFSSFHRKRGETVHEA
jgi:hypothetical protein